MEKIATLLFSACVAMSATAQSKARTANYFPQGNAFVCVNGNNRYSRALYGSNRSEWRLETSDVPIFATYKKDVCRNIRFQVLASDGIFALDSASYCMAGYVGGRRDYTIRDPRLGNGTLRMAVVAFPDREGAIWRLVGDSLDGIHVGCLVGNVTGKAISAPSTSRKQVSPNGRARSLWPRHQDYCQLKAANYISSSKATLFFAVRAMNWQPYLSLLTATVNILQVQSSLQLPIHTSIP